MLCLGVVSMRNPETEAKRLVPHWHAGAQDPAERGPFTSTATGHLRVIMHKLAGGPAVAGSCCVLCGHSAQVLRYSPHLTFHLLICTKSGSGDFSGTADTKFAIGRSTLKDFEGSAIDEVL